MHHKERAIGPVLLNQCGLKITVPNGLDTDALGTFSGEIPRAGTMREAAIAKARLAMAATGLPLGLASEGSYGPHPQIPWFPAGIELMLLVDDTRGIVVTEQLIDDTPTFSHIATPSLQDITDYLGCIDFPRTAVIVKPNSAPAGTTTLFKGMVDKGALEDAIRHCATVSDDAKALVQTDMRAHMNARRMEMLSKLANRLAVRLNSCCPSCHTPGFGVVGPGAGLPCEWCGEATVITDGGIFGCVRCQHTEHVPRDDGRKEADPAYCPHCNP
jgi:hypothetical protein